MLGYKCLLILLTLIFHNVLSITLNFPPWTTLTIFIFPIELLSILIWSIKLLWNPWKEIHQIVEQVPFLDFSHFISKIDCKVEPNNTRAFYAVAYGYKTSWNHLVCYLENNMPGISHLDMENRSITWNLKLMINIQMQVPEKNSYHHLWSYDKSWILWVLS